MSRVRSAIVGGLLFLATAFAFGEEGIDALPSVGFDCWVGDDGKPYFINYIRCIPDRDLDYKPELNKRSDDLLEALHQELHLGSGTGAERKFKTNIQLIREAGGIWNIRINTYPYEWSWAEGRPQALVRAILCPEKRTCIVMLRED